MLFDAVGFIGNYNARVDAMHEIYEILKEKLITLYYDEESKKVYLYSKFNEIYKEFENYKCPLTLAQIDTIVIRAFKKHTSTQESIIGSLKNDLETAYKNQSFIYTIVEGYRFKVKWKILQDKEDKINTVVFPDSELQIPDGTWIEKDDLQTYFEKYKRLLFQRSSL